MRQKLEMEPSGLSCIEMGPLFASPVITERHPLGKDAELKIGMDIRGQQRAWKSGLVKNKTLSI